MFDAAISIKPNRPEAYYVISLFYTWRKEWLTAYMYSCIGLQYTDISHKPFRRNSYHTYKHKNQLEFQKGISGYYKGKVKESINIFRNLLNKEDLDYRIKNSIERIIPSLKI